MPNIPPFSASFKTKVLEMKSDDFETLAMEAFLYQSKHNPIYAQYIGFLGIEPRKIQHLHEIPFLPIEFFKTQQVLCQGISPIKTFESSGTTGQNASKHHMADLDFYDQLAKNIFEKQYGPLEGYQILALLPSYLERNTSSLVHMIDNFLPHAGSESGFYLHDLTALARKMILLGEKGDKILLWGVTFALLDLAEMGNVSLGDAIVMETGGMKGRRREMLREEVHAQLCQQLHTPKIHSEYGMTELYSQAYSVGDGIFSEPLSMKLFIREINDPFSLHRTLDKTGGVNIIDLGNIDSCCFIETKDIGRLSGNGFEILGRFDNSDIRGCNLLVS